MSETIATSVPTTEAPSVQAEIVDSVGADYKDFTPLYDRFGIHNQKDDRVNRNLEVIWKYAKDRAETKDKENILWEVTKLNNKIGDAHGGSAPYTKMLAYISEFNRMREAESRLKEMEHYA